MSSIVGAFSGTVGGLAASAAAQLIQSIFVRPRNIGGFTADVTLSEDHLDTLTITRHPVAQNATISDHAFKEPATVVIQCGWSNSSLQALFDPNYVQNVYAQFLTLQASKSLFSVVTGKRSYDNMLIHNLRCKTDHNSENVLMLTVECQQLILANTATVTLPPSQLASPAINSATQNTGTTQLQPSTKYNQGAGP